MRKFVASVLALVFLLGLGSNMGAIFANDHDGIYVEECGSYEDAPGIPYDGARWAGSGRMATRRNSHDFGVSWMGNSLVHIGTMETQAWWEVDDRLNMRGFGPEFMSIRPGALHHIGLQPRIEVYVNRLPHPQTAWVGFQGTFFTLIDIHIVLHDYHMHTNGTYTFRIV